MDFHFQLFCIISKAAMDIFVCSHLWWFPEIRMHGSVPAACKEGMHVIKAVTTYHSVARLLRTSSGTPPRASCESSVCCTTCMYCFPGWRALSNLVILVSGEAQYMTDQSLKEISLGNNTEARRRQRIPSKFGISPPVHTMTPRERSCNTYWVFSGKTKRIKVALPSQIYSPGCWP